VLVCSVLSDIMRTPIDTRHEEHNCWNNIFHIGGIMAGDCHKRLVRQTKLLGSISCEFHTHLVVSLAIPRMLSDGFDSHSLVDGDGFDLFRKQLRSMVQ